MTFDAVVETEDEGVFVELPPDAEFAPRPRAGDVTINGQTWESTVAGYSGRFYLPLRRGDPRGGAHRARRHGQRRRSLRR